jgi:hypothetical protein
MPISRFTRVPRHLIALVAGLLIVPVVGGKLTAQESPDASAYAPDSRYQQPEYPQQSYPQQSYPQQSYTQQPDAPPSAEQQYADSGEGNAQGSGQVAPLNPQDLEQLVAPIALYPDALVAQVLTASTYPEQVADADRWVRSQGYAPPEQIAAGADARPWDPSVKALTAFPRVLAQMDQNLHWTSDLGAAYYNQPQDTLDAVQEMRQRAHEAGNLQSTPQQAVNYEQGNIEVAPANPETVYVPSYNPWAVYGEPVAPYPGFSLVDAVGSFFASSALRFGAGIALSAFTQAPWGWLGWGLDWLGHGILFNHSNYFSHSATVADWGLRYGGPRSFSQRGTFAGRGYGAYGRAGRNGFARYGRSNGEYARGRSQGFAQTRNEDAYARNQSRDNRGYQTFGAHYGRPLGQTSRGFQTASARSRQYGSQQSHYSGSNGSQGYGSRAFGNSAYGSSYRGESNTSYGGRSSAGYGRSEQASRSQGGNFQRSGFGNGYSGSSRGNGFAKSSSKQGHFGGSHFSSGHGSKNYGSKNYSSKHSGGGGKSFSHGGGHSGGHSGGGHSGGHGHSGGGGKHHH